MNLWYAASAESRGKKKNRGNPSSCGEVMEKLQQLNNNENPFCLKKITAAQPDKTHIYKHVAIRRFGNL